jgi:UDP-glucose 6-dehydrogenase
VYEDNRGFGGSCLPKDLSAIIYPAHEKNVKTTLLEGVREKNKEYK